MSSIVSVGGRNKKYPICPICGKPDWCGIVTDDYGNEYIVCERTKQGGNISGYDGRLYCFVKETGEGNYMFEEIQQRIQRKGKNFVSNDEFKTFEPKKAIKVVDQEIKVWDNAKLNKVYHKILDMLILEPRHKQYLLNEGWTEAEILHFGIKSMPPTDNDRKNNNIVTDNPKRYTIAQELYKEFGDLEGVPGAYFVETEKGGFWTLAGAEGILFPIVDIEDNIYRLRIRLDKPSSNGKYRNLSSHLLKEINGVMANIYNKGCSSGNHLSIEDSLCKNKFDYTICYITEGEKKAKIVNSRLKSPCIDVPGVSSYMLLFDKDSSGKSIIQKMVEKGTKVFLVAFDADKSTNKNVSDCEKRILEGLENEGVQRGVTNWNIEFGKGIDDVLLKGYAIQYDFIN